MGNRIEAKPNSCTDYYVRIAVPCCRNRNKSLGAGIGTEEAVGSPDPSSAHPYWIGHCLLATARSSTLFLVEIEREVPITPVVRMNSPRFRPWLESEIDLPG